MNLQYKMYLYLLLVCAPAVMGQLFLGPCPYPPQHIKDLDLGRYSGDWYVVAQSTHHPLKASDCQRVKYFEKKGGLAANISKVDGFGHSKTHTNATLTREYGKASGELKLRFSDFPRSFEFRVLKTNYSDVAVEYVCLSGVFNYTASVTVLHRRLPMNNGNLNEMLKHLNVSNITSDFAKNMKLVTHTQC